MSEMKVAAEVAEAEFERFLEAMDIDADRDSMDDEDKKSFEDAKRRIVAAIQSGRLTVDDRGQPVFTPGDGEPLTFSEPTGASLLAMDQKKKGHDMHRMYAVLANITGRNSTTFSKMPHRDLKICLALVAVFLS